MRRPALALLLGCLLLVAGASALDGYDYYQTIEYAGCDQEVYQQDIVIHRSAGTAYNETSGGLETWHIYVGDHCREDYGDIRFTNSTGAELAYYLWPDYSSESARFCVRLEGADQSGALTVWYGNPNATTTSDGDATYPLFDDFVGSSVDTTKWIVHIGALGSPSVSVSNGEITFKSGATGSGARYVAIESKQLFGSGYQMVGKLRASATGNRPQRYAIIGFGATYHLNTVNQLGDLVAAPGGAYWRDAGSSDAYWSTVHSGAQGSGTWTRSEKRVSTSYQIFSTSIRSDGIDWDIDGTTYSYASNPITGEIPVVVGIDAHRTTSGYQTTDIVDWVLVRAYSATPPAAITFSGEVESDAPQPFPGLTLIPRDLAGNGLYTDINGNNRLDYNDLTVFFQHLAWAKTAQPIACFDFNGNGWLDYNDVITLFSIIMEEHT